MTSLYSIQVQLTDTTPIFNGYFEVDDATTYIQHFYDTSNIGTDILGTTIIGSNNYYNNTPSLNSNGTLITSFPYIYGSDVSPTFKLTGTTTDNTGTFYINQISQIPILYVITPIGSIPSSTSPISQASTSIYSTSWVLPDTTVMFNGYFVMSSVNNTIIHFYDTSNISVDILTNDGILYGGVVPDNIFDPTDLISTSNGIGITSFPYFYDGATANPNQVWIHPGGDWGLSINNTYFLATPHAATTLIFSIPSSTSPIVNSKSSYNYTITLPDTTLIQYGFFWIDKVSNIIQNFYDLHDGSDVYDRLSSGSWSSPDNMYQPGWNSFDASGVNLTAFRYYSNVSSGDYHLVGDTSSTSGTITVQTGTIPSSSIIFNIFPGAPQQGASPAAPLPGPPSGVVCFKEGSKILTNTGYKPIQELRKGDLVQTSKNGYKAIFMIGKRDIEHIGSEERIKDQLYSCKQEQYPELLEELVITGCHSILVSDFKEGERERTRDVNGKIFVTDNKYRLPACVDMRASVYDKKGVHTIYHIALENDDYYMNYGVYANGLLVETCSKRYLKELSNMEELF
jgi:hypothetical protein